MKKILAAAMAMAMVLSLAACGNSGDGGNSTTSGNNQSNTSSSQAGGSQTTDVSDFKVGAIYINSKNDTAGYTYAHHNGITKAMEALGMDPDTQLIIQDEITEDYENVATAVDTLVGEDCDIIFGLSFGYLNAMADKAEEYPEYAETCSGINGFALGVQAVNPDATVYVKELGNWFDEVNEYAFAEELINSYNCGVIAQHCDSAQPQLAAEKAGVFGCGYNSDMTKDAPNAHLTAPVWNWDVYYKLAIETAMACEGDASQFVEKMGGEAWYGGLAEGFVDVSPLSDNCAAGTQDAIDQVRELIVSGAWDVFSGVKLKVTVADGKAAVEQ